ncbi:hypothetical protein M5X00_24195 [Paenibacillus alvei]|uniref:Uncharacterized protein n=1 Tax=Paenibacillus alvei TaxID=44250 RepID=A0ABT4GR16_PAEAL|nr:hypothetical protein [Paenibacillus alvei]MCY9543621.1 hypothetical protein [Paenibacillus alvei]MCY9736124.1 hypothetical protein [Paenibacillus alvei]MCY9757331.1 hypothetical protein [Paenibacillus alvei]MCY9759138.1 hypothetical protein [Paenibacillus alvei]MCY9770403.1 hypothetical protein [Paenibacillus alvei]
MSIQELIDSYPVYFNLDKFILYWLVIGIILVAIFNIILYIIDKDFISLTTVGLSVVLMVFVVLVIGVGIQAFYNKPVDEARVKWKEEVFHKQYLSSLKEMKIDIVDYSIDKDGSISVLLDTTEKVKSIGGIRQISYYTSKDPVGRGYIKAKYVEQIDQIGIAAGFYEVQAFIPKLTK